MICDGIEIARDGDGPLFVPEADIEVDIDIENDAENRIWGAASAQVMMRPPPAVLLSSSIGSR